jgi:hypothetical protein
MRCHALFARCCAALPIAVVFMLAALSQLPGDEGSRVVIQTKGMTSLELTDAEATFGPRIPAGGVAGTLRLAVPIEGCERLKNKYDGPWIALLKRGGVDPSCSFVTKVRPTRVPGWLTRHAPADEDSRGFPNTRVFLSFPKRFRTRLTSLSCARATCLLSTPRASFVYMKLSQVRYAQYAGAIAAIVYDDRAGALTPMAKAPTDADVGVPSVFVSEASGNLLTRAILESDPDDDTDERGVVVRISPGALNATDPVSLAASAFAVFVVTAAVLSMFWFAQRFNPRARAAADAAALAALARADPQDRVVTLAEVEARSKTRAHSGSPRSASEAATLNGTNEVCTVCLDEYEEGDEIRELECEHAFHKTCIDEWLTTKRACCPCCKHSLVPAPAPSGDARDAPGTPPRRRRRRRRGRGRGAGTERAAARGDGDGDEDAGDVEAAGRTGDEEEDLVSATVPLLASRGDREDESSSNAGGVFGWVSRLAGRNRAAAAAAEMDDDDDDDDDDAAEPPYVAPRAVDVETGGE